MVWAAGSPPAARCAVHPDRAADAGVCERCGTFMCVQCRAPAARGELCRDCHARMDQGTRLRHLQPLAIAMMVHGGFLVMGGLFALVYGAAIGSAFLSMPEPGPDAGEHAAIFESVLVWALLGEGALHAAVGAWQGWAGWRVHALRGRTTALFALFAGLLTVLGCYCAPTSLGLLVWGLIVLLHPSVARRFAGVAGSGNNAP